MSCHDDRDDGPVGSETAGTGDLRRKILELVAEYAAQEHAVRRFEPGESPVPVSGRVYGAEELCALVDASLDFWLTSGRYNETFEQRLAERLELSFARTTNSGSSANLLAISALTSPRLKRRRLVPGDEVITAAAAFPTTVNPIIQNRLVPVFVDAEIPTYNPSLEAVERALGPKTRAVVLAHTLGNPFDVRGISDLAKAKDLWLIEDCCDALGSRFEGSPVGTFGDLATFSFYPAHHITMGEGGAVVTDRRSLERIVISLRDWGRDCWCAPGHDNTCGRRFEWQLGQLPRGYDHKYIYSHLGYNLKITDMQAAIGVAQLERLDRFVAARNANFERLRKRLEELEGILILPEATPGANPAWFGFPITVRDSAPFPRDELVGFLNRHRIATRNLFAGNLIRQPYMLQQDFRVSGTLTQTDVIMERTFWIGVYPGLTDDHIDYMADCMIEFAATNGA